MSTPIKIGVFLVSVTVILTVSLTFFIKTQVTPEKVRRNLLPLLEKTLERKVDFGEISIGLFSGISVSDLQVMQKDAEGAFLSVASVGLRYQLWALLTGKIVVDQILLDQPKILFTRLPDGQFNFSDMLPESSAEKSNTAGSHKNTSKALSANINLLIKEVIVKGGELQYVDKFKNVRSPFRYALNQLNVKVRQITFDHSFPIDLSAVVNGSNIDISGNYDMSRLVGDLTIHLAPLDLLQFAPYYRDILPGKLGSARLGLNLEVDIQPDMISSKGKIVFDDVDLVLSKFQETALKNARFSADYALNYSLDKQLLDVSTLLLDFNDINLGAEGEFDLSTSDPFLVFTFLFDQFDLREVMQNLPLELSRDYQKYSFAGLIDGKIELSGRLNSGANLVKSVQLSLSDVRASSDKLRAGISGDIAYVDNVLQSENLLLQYGDQQVQLQLKAEKSLNHLLVGEFGLTAKTLDLNKILPEPSLVAKDSSANGHAVPKVQRRKTLADDIGPFDIPADMVGTMAIDRLLYEDLIIDNVTADLTLRNNQLSIRNLSSQIGRGELKATSLVNLGVKGLAYQGEVSLSQPNIMTLVSGLFPGAKQEVSGLLRWQNNFSGKGTIPDNLLPALQLKGNFDLQDGEAKGSKLIEELASFLGSSDLKVLSFQSLTGQYDLQGGVTRLSGHLDSSKTRLTSTGTIATDGHLNINLNASFAPEIMDKLGVSKNLKQSISDQDDWGTLPIQIQGTISHPEIGYDSAALQNQLLEKAKEKASQKIIEKLVPDTGEGTEPIKKMLDNTLDKLFGK